MPLTDKTFSQCQPCWGFKPANQIFPKLHMDGPRRSGMKGDGVKDKWEQPRRKEEEEGGRSQPLRLDRMQFCFHCVKSSELSSEAWVWPVGRCGKRWSPREIAVRRVLSCYGTVRCYQVPIGSPENAVQRGLLFSNPYRCLSLLLQASSNGGCQERKLETTWTGSGIFFYESSFLLFKNASEICSGIGGLTSCTCSTSLLGLQITLCDVIEGTRTPYRLVTIVAARCSLHLLKPLYFWPFHSRWKVRQRNQEATMRCFYCRL